MILALLLAGCVSSDGGTKRYEWSVDLLEANFLCDRGEEGANARWMDSTSSSVFLHVLNRKRTTCDAFIRGKYRVEGQVITVELVNGVVPACEPLEENCILDTEMSLAEPAVDPTKDVQIDVVIAGGQIYTVTLPARA